MSNPTLITDTGLNQYGVGCTLITQLSLMIKKEIVIVPQDVIAIQVGLEIYNEVTKQWETIYTPLGTFYVDSVEEKGTLKSIKAYDQMYKLRKGYFPSAKHTTTYAIANDIARITGLNLKGISYNSNNVNISNEQLEGKTQIEMLSLIAGSIGGHVRISRDGSSIEFIEPTNYGEVYTESDYTTPTLDDATSYHITKLRINYSDKITNDEGAVIDEGYYEVGTGNDANTLELSNPLLKNQQAQATNVLNKIKQLNEYKRFDTTLRLGDYRLEPMDVVTYTKGEVEYLVPILYMKMTLTYRGISIETQSPTVTETKREFSFKGTLTQKVENIYADLIQVKQLTANKVTTDVLEATVATIEKLYVKHGQFDKLVGNSLAVQEINANIANINELVAGKADISELNAAVANINILNTDLGVIKDLVNGNLSSENIQAGGITSDKLTITNGFIKDAMIDSLNANKITAGQINTALVQVASSSGNLVINDNTIQIRDANRVRVQIGKDTSNDYSISVWDSNGKLMFDARGLKADAIKDSIIRNDMISANANIDGSKLNISSVVSEINEGATSLKASKVQIDGVAQTLELAFSVLKTQADSTKAQMESNTTAINVSQGKINTLIQDTTITKDGQTVKLKDEYTKLEQTVGSLSSTISKQQMTIDDHTGKLTAFNSEIVSLKQNLNGLNLSVSTAETTIQSHTQQLAQKVDLETVTQKIDAIPFEGRNLIIRHNELKNMMIGMEGIPSTFDGSSLMKEFIAVTPGEELFFSQTFVSGGDNYFRYAFYTEDQETVIRRTPNNAISFKETVPNGAKWLRVSYDTNNVVKLERGAKATDWTEAPEDIQASIDAKANHSDVYVKTEVYTKGQTDSAINLAKDSINLGISQTYETKQNVESKISISRTEAINTSKSYADNKKAEAISAASTDATNKVNSAKSELNTAINKKANSTDVYTKIETYTKAETDSKIKVAKDEINLSVSSTYETKVDVTAKLNGVNASISTLQQRVSTAESKITDTAIINTVKKNFYTKEETNTQITSKGYQTASQVQQLVDQVAFNFNQSGGYNLLLNSRWEYDFFNWNPHSNCSRILDAATGLYYVRIPMVVGSNQGMAQSFKVEKGRTYTVSAQVDVEAGAIAGVEISYTDASGTKKWVGANTTSSTNYKNGVLFFTWTPDISCETGVNFYARGNHGSGVTAGAYVRWRYTQVEQGSTQTGWSPNPYEIYQGQTLINKNGVRVNASNVGTYTEMAASGFFVKYNNGNKLFEASNCIKLYDNNNVSAIEVLINPSAAYGNAMINVRGGINFLHKPGQSTGTNGIQLGNHDVSNQYGMHNLSIRCHNSLGFADNGNLTNMFLDVRRGRMIMKGALYQNTQTPPTTFSMNFDGEDEIYNSGYERIQAIDSVMNLKTGVYVDNDGECCSAIYGGYSELITTEYRDEEGLVTTHLNHEALNASLVVTCQEQQALIDRLQKELNDIKEYLNIA